MKRCVANPRLARLTRIGLPESGLGHSRRLRDVG
jgi:hypothetical protein